MNKFYTLIICLFLGSIAYGQDPCNDINAFTFHTPCGDEFQLCMDRYELENHQSVELQVHTNDLGQIDKCSSYICSPCNHGELAKLPAPNCNYVYTPDEDFYGNDTFYYAMVINDSCSDEPCEGKMVLACPSLKLNGSTNSMNLKCREVVLERIASWRKSSFIHPVRRISLVRIMDFLE